MGDFLWSIIPWGYQVLLDIEGMRTAFLDVLFPIITDLGSEMGYIVILSLIYWCVSKPVMQGLAYAYLFTMALNTWIKDLWCIPRPDDPALEPVLERAGVTRRLQPLRHETSPSFLSGHSQGAAVSWGYMAHCFKKIWFRIVTVILITLIAFSRMYVGVHFPQDVIGGLVVGAVYLLLWLWAEPHVRARLARLGTGWRYALAVLVPLVVLIVHPVEGTATSMGALIGLGIGFLLEGQTLRFTTAGRWWQRVLRGALGLAVVLVAYFGLSALFGLFDERMGATMAVVWRIIRYALVGFVGGWGAPWLFTLSGLAGRETEGGKT
jgi:membrane-associated phospholipid phosphatase